MTVHRQHYLLAIIGAMIVVCAFFPRVLPEAAERGGAPLEPGQAIEAYVRATYARDFIQAYRFISSADRKVRDEARYIQQRGAFGGFTLEAARKLAEAIEIKIAEQKTAGDRAQVLVRYRVPDTGKIAPTLLDWDSYRLNSLSSSAQKQLLAALDQKRQNRSLEMIEGEARFEVVKEGKEWRVFLNWASGVRIPLRLDLSKSADLEVSISQPEVFVQPGEIFDIALKVKNKSKQPITARIGHLVEPQASANYLDFVQCGFLLPVTIAAEREQEYFGTYMVRGNLPEDVRQLNLTYDFRILP